MIRLLMTQRINSSAICTGVNSMNYNMIVLDLDGTLTNRDKVITPRTKQSLMEAQKRGIKGAIKSAVCQKLLF